MYIHTTLRKKPRKLFSLGDGARLWVAALSPKRRPAVS